ncbi:MAG TPA: lipid-binding SYLF domain-containing protein [Stellaceae bacterium]|nr:lipid-binding SYLF domain-containing protein [Stellaceae bacterium]
MRRLMPMLLLLLLLAPGVAPAAQVSDQQKVVDGARRTLAQLTADKTLGGPARDLLHKARAVLIVPQLVKAGFILGGEGGDGVLLARDAAGNWSYPSFCGMGGGSIGLQIGGEVSRIVLIIMTEPALRAVMRDEFKIGAEAGITVVTLGGGAEASTTANAGADIYAVARSKGLFGGIALQGAIIAPSTGWNHAYYGRDVTAEAIVLRHAAANPGAEALRSALARF